MLQPTKTIERRLTQLVLYGAAGSLVSQERDPDRKIRLTEGSRNEFITLVIIFN
jgi:hypothetical protein